MSVAFIIVLIRPRKRKLVFINTIVFCLIYPIARIRSKTEDAIEAKKSLLNHLIELKKNNCMQYAFYDQLVNGYQTLAENSILKVERIFLIRNYSYLIYFIISFILIIVIKKKY